MNGTPLIAICRSHRTESTPHWQHDAYMWALKMPMKPIRIDEGHTFDIGASRSLTVKMGLSLPQVQLFLFLDDDIVPPDSETVMDMWRFMEAKPAERHIVSGVYFEKGPLSRPIIMSVGKREGKLVFALPLKEEDITKGNQRLVKAGVVPAGFLLVRREVFEKLEWPPFKYNAPEIQAQISRPEENRPGEDVYFSLKAREAGYDLWVDLRHPLLHFCPAWRGPRWLIDEFNQKNELDTQLAAAQTELAKVT